MRLFPLALVAAIVVQSPALAESAKAPKPLGNPGDWVTSNDYPASALREQAEGTARFTLTIDATGVPTGCALTQSTGSPVLDEATCTLVQARARFAPATDKRGQPVAATWSSSIRWVIPSTRPLPEAGDETLTFVVEKDGSVTGCTWTGQGQDSPETHGTEACEQFAKSTQFESPKDAAGKSVRQRITRHEIVTVETIPD